MNILIADLSTISDELLKKELSLFEDFLGRVLKIENIDKLILNCTEKQKQFVEIAKTKKFTSNICKKPPNDIIELLKECHKIAKKEKAKNISLVYGDSPLLDYKVSNQLFKLHLDNFAEYTFGDDYPEGITAEFFNFDFLEKIITFQSKKPEIDSRKIFNCTNADINQFYVEVDLPEIDISRKRLNLTASSERNLELIKRIVSHCDGEFFFDKLPGIIENNPEILRIFPKYVEIELTNECNLKCSFCPINIISRPVARMDFELYKKIIDELSSTFDDIIVCLSLYGEPTLHKDLIPMINYNLENKIKSTILETNGVTFGKNIADELTDIDSNRFQVIFGLDAVSEELYKRIKSGADLGTVTANIKYYLDKDERNLARTFLQIVKMKETLHEIDKFFGFWEPVTKNLILQKYNNFAGQLQDRKVADLTPLERIPCWHLQRDLVVFCNGDVPICKQDFQGTKILGNLKKETIKEIWARFLPIYNMDYRGDYSGFELCSKCDEWYTYNF